MSKTKKKKDWVKIFVLYQNESREKCLYPMLMSVSLLIVKFTITKWST